MTTETILLEPSEADLAAAVEENLYALFRAMAALPGGVLVEGNGLSHHLAFPANPMFKGVWRARLAAEEADEAIAATLAWFAAREAPFIFWWTGPETTPSDLGERLARLGLISMEEQQQFAPDIRTTEAGAPGMAADLRLLDVSALARVPAGFTIEEVCDEPALDDFRQVLNAGFGMPEWAAQAWVDASRRVGIGRTPWRLYLGRLNGEPAATNMLFNGGGVASVYGLTTIPAARRQGIGAAMTVKPLLDARDEGYRYAVLFSTESGRPMYERIGFRDTGARINRYLWRNDS